ncbi:MAG: AAA family ATPase [Gammaproteobacteria bacterium]|nr:AAA family ATPase [Gammaproteobacteria bacterium]
MMKSTQPLPVEALATRCRPDDLPFQSTEELGDLADILGQERALEALRFGLAGRRPGYNLFALGASGIGKHSAVMRMLEQRAAQGEVPPDLCYVANFEEPARPRLLRLPAGRGAVLRQDMQHLVEELVGSLPAALDSEEFKARMRQIDQSFEQRQAEAIQALRDKAEAQQVKLYEQPGEFTFAPLRDGQTLDVRAFNTLPDDEKHAIETKVGALQAELTEILEQQIPQWQKERRAALRALHRDTTRAVVQHLLASLRAQYADLPAVSAYLDSVEQAVIHSTRDFLQREGADAIAAGDHAVFRNYQVNLLVDHSATHGAPVVFEDNPTFTALVGRIEHQAQLGALVTDFNLIRAGALHRANGGYLLIDARKLLTQPFAWEGLKRTLRAHELRIESMGQAYSLISTVSLEPEALPLDVKVVLEGDRALYYLLQAYDPEFAELFKVAADFEDVIERNDANVTRYVQLIATLVRRENLRAFDRGAVAAVIDHSARLAADGCKLSTRMRDIVDILQEADFYAGEAGQTQVRAEAVARAIQARIERADRVRDQLHEEIRRGVLNIATTGKSIGQVNGLTVLEAGSFSFGLPARITATTRLGEGEVIDIEREVDMGGPIHSKGVFILSSFLGARYAQNFPLSLSASLAFEQSYSGVEGDSASLAELCALLSSLAGLPLDQSLAVTGSVDQLGRVQAVGGVNEKIEGFFDVCAQRGLTGTQGVLLPQSNVQHLMLRKEVVDAVREGRFRVYAVADVDAAMALLTGRSPGRARALGEFPPKSINGRVQERLADFARLRMAFSGAVREAPAAGGEGAA